MTICEDLKVMCSKFCCDVEDPQKIHGTIMVVSWRHVTPTMTRMILDGAWCQALMVLTSTYDQEASVLSYGRPSLAISAPDVGLGFCHKVHSMQLAAADCILCQACAFPCCHVSRLSASRARHLRGLVPRCRPQDKLA